VVKPGGRVGVAVSNEPDATWAKWLADGVEAVVWKIPALSLGCRSVHVLPALTAAGATVIFQKKIGIPLWPFLVFVVKKP